MDQADELAERVQRGALRKMALFGAAFMLWQISYFTLARPVGDTLRAVDIVRTAGFLVWSAALPMLFAKSGAAFLPRAVRAIVDDELAQARRAIGYRNGFWAMTLVNFAGYLSTMAFQLKAVDLAHIGLSAGVLTVLATQLWLERGTGD